MRPSEEFSGNFFGRVDGLPGLVDHDPGRAGGLRVDLEDDGLGDPNAARLEGGLERGTEVDHLAVRRPEARLHQEMALILRRRVEQDVRDSFRRQVEVDVFRVAVRGAHLPVLELVTAFRVGLDQAHDVMLADEAEPTVANLNRGQEVPQVHPTVRVHLQAVPLREMSEDAGHRAAEEFDLLVVEEELAFAAAVRAELFPEIPVRTTFLEHASPPLGGWYSPSAYEPSSCGSTERSASRMMRRPRFSSRSSNVRTSGFERLLRCTYASVAPSVRSTAWSIARSDPRSSA